MIPAMTTGMRDYGAEGGGRGLVWLRGKGGGTVSRSRKKRKKSRERLVSSADLLFRSSPSWAWRSKSTSRPARKSSLLVLALLDAPRSGGVSSGSEGLPLAPLGFYLSLRSECKSSRGSDLCSSPPRRSTEERNLPS